MKYEKIVLGSIKAAERNTINIGYSLDKNYVRYMLVSMLSVLEKNKDTAVVFHVVTDGFLPENLKKIDELTKSYNAKAYIYTLLEKVCFPIVSESITIGTYFRFFLPEFVKDTDRVLYLDADVVCNGSLDQLFALEFRDKIIAAVPDLAKMNKLRNDELGLPAQHIYFNNGVLLMNISAWQQAKVFSKIQAAVERLGSKIRFEDQDALNSVLTGKVFYLPPAYNCIDMLSPSAAAADLLHFAAKPKPWSKWWQLNPLRTDWNKGLYQHYEKILFNENKIVADGSAKNITKWIIKKITYRLLKDRYQPVCNK